MICLWIVLLSDSSPLKNLNNTIVIFVLVALEKLKNALQMINVRDKLLHLVDDDLNILFARLQNYPPPHLKLDEIKGVKQYDEDFTKTKLETRS